MLANMLLRFDLHDHGVNIQSTDHRDDDCPGYKPYVFKGSGSSQDTYSDETFKDIEIGLHLTYIAFAKITMSSLWHFCRCVHIILCVFVNCV